MGAENKDTGLEIFLATVKKVYIKSEDFLDLQTKTDYVKIYNSNKNFDKKDARFLGAIEFYRPNARKLENYAFPFDKNNVTYPIVGETVMVIKNSDEYFWLPYTIGQYPNYREDYKTAEGAKEKELPIIGKADKQSNYRETQQTGTPNATPSSVEKAKKDYNVNEKIKFLKPKTGDTILQGRVGNTIRFSEFFLTPDDKTSCPAIYIRNKQNGELDSKPIGTLIEEDINKDGSSLYFVSDKIKVPFTETIKKDKVGFKQYPGTFDGDQVFLNSDRVLLSAKANEFIIYGKKSTGVITDGMFSVDAKDEIYMHNEKNITLHTKEGNQIFLNSNSSGKVFLGKDGSSGDDGAAVQHMVLAGELKKILEDLIDEINKQVYLTPCGPTSVGPTNAAAFTGIKSRLKVFYSARNFLAKD
jgi:hypothetical protein